MKDITLFLTEQLNLNVNEGNESIKDEKSFREYAETKLKEVHGDDYNEDKAKETIDGILNDNKELVDKGDWGALVGVLNKGVIKENLNESYISRILDRNFDKMDPEDLFQLQFEILNFANGANKNELSEVIGGLQKITIALANKYNIKF